MMNSRTMLQRMKQTAFLAVIAAAGWACEAPDESRAPAELTADCPDGSELVSEASAGGAGEACQLAIGIAACPSEAQLADDGLRQRCQRDVGVRHGASSQWYENGRNRIYTEWWEGAKHGKFTLWYENGQVRSEGFHAHGKPAGEWTYYAEDGSVLERRTFSTPPPAATWLADALAGRPPVEAK
jgi:MORN repeat variant